MRSGSLAVLVLYMTQGEHCPMIESPRMQSERTYRVHLILCITKNMYEKIYMSIVPDVNSTANMFLPGCMISVRLFCHPINLSICCLNSCKKLWNVDCRFYLQLLFQIPTIGACMSTPRKICKLKSLTHQAFIFLMQAHTLAKLTECIAEVVLSLDVAEVEGLSLKMLLKFLK